MTRAQCLAAGLSVDAVRGQRERGFLHPLHRGVYRVGPLEAPLMRAMAAALACGTPAVVSHATAGGLLKIVPARPGDPVHVRAPGGRRRLKGVRVHRTPRPLPDDEVTPVEGVPVTTACRTLLDLAGAMDDRRLERAVAEAFALGTANEAGLLRLLVRHPRHRGSGLLRRLLGSGPALTRSRAEELFLALVVRAKLARPAVNVRIAGFEVDFAWRRERLVVEIDGFRYHRSRRSFEIDRRKGANLVAAGFRVLRFTWRQVVEEPEAVAAQLAGALAHGSWR